MGLAAAVIAGVVILLVAQDVFETVILPRRVTRRFRIARFFFVVTWRAWKFLALRMRTGARREGYLGYYGPLSLLALFAFWAVLYVMGFAMLAWGMSLPLDAPEKTTGFLTYLYMSGTTFFTLGLGDVTPMSEAGRALTVIEVAAGFGFLALVISYVPVIYQAFSRRELRISLLDARAGSPATAVELLRRNCAGKNTDELRILLRDWEAWCADFLESHLSYPVLAYYRSQHDQQSWLGALTVILDTCALILSGMENIPPQAAKFTFAIARHAVVDLAQVFNASPLIGTNRLSSAEYAHLREVLATSGIRLSEVNTQGVSSEQKLADLRATYEPFVTTLASTLLLSLPPWFAPEGSLDDWQTTAWDDMMPSTRETLRKVMHKDSGARE
jgi:hypothetical protein